MTITTQAILSVVLAVLASGLLQAALRARRPRPAENRTIRR